jgi:hypothetical protein
MVEPITIERFVQAMEALRRDMDAGALKHGEYDQRLARLIGELRERKLAADRPGLTAALDDMLRRGVIPPSVRQHLRQRLGLDPPPP